jgi:predicted transcriptional regulator
MTQRLNRDTSVEAYRELLESGQMSRKEKMIYQAIVDMGGKATNTNIATYLRLPINQVTGRVRALYLKGLITENQRVNNPHTGRANWQWKLV